MRSREIWVILGTAGELIKVAPVLRELDQREQAWNLVHSGQSGVNFWLEWDTWGLTPKNTIRMFAKPEDLKTSGSALSWALQFFWSGRDHFFDQVPSHYLPADQFGQDIFIVHGDTLTTLLGSWLARRVGGELWHLEAGLRSESLLEPFPEEINRRLTSQLARVHFPQDENAKEYLKASGVRGKIYETFGNTLSDAILCARQQSKNSLQTQQRFVLANLHRHENLTNPNRWNFLVSTIIEIQKTFQVVFVLHPPAQQKLAEDLISLRKLQTAGVMFSTRLRFHTFISYLANSEFLLSDGGSNQEECYYLGHPCLLLRETTERTEGLGSNALLSQFQWERVLQFILNYEDYRREEKFPTESPSKRVVDKILEHRPSD